MIGYKGRGYIASTRTGEYLEFWLNVGKSFPYDKFKNTSKIFQ